MKKQTAIFLLRGLLTGLIFVSIGASTSGCSSGCRYYVEKYIEMTNTLTVPVTLTFKHYTYTPSSTPNPEFTETLAAGETKVIEYGVVEMQKPVDHLTGQLQALCKTEATQRKPDQVSFSSATLATYKVCAETVYNSYANGTDAFGPIYIRAATDSCDVGVYKKPQVIIGY